MTQRVRMLQGPMVSTVAILAQGTHSGRCGNAGLFCWPPSNPPGFPPPRTTSAISHHLSDWCTGHTTATKVHPRCNSNICVCCSLRLKQRHCHPSRATCTFKWDVPLVLQAGWMGARSTSARCFLNTSCTACPLPLSTVLAQDHFYSDFLSLHVTLQTLMSTRRMSSNCLPTRRVPQGLSCRFDDPREQQ